MSKLLLKSKVDISISLKDLQEANNLNNYIFERFKKRGKSHLYLLNKLFIVVFFILINYNKYQTIKYF